MDDLIADFVAECREMLEALGGEIVAWEAQPEDRARLDSIFRFVHTVKGNCGFFDFPRLEALSHAALVECRLETGRTHQVRVHLASIGHPLIGDPVYGRGGRTHHKLLNDLGFQRQALHAAELGFTHPVTKHKLSFVSPMPPDMEELLSALGV